MSSTTARNQWPLGCPWVLQVLALAFVGAAPAADKCYVCEPSDGSGLVCALPDGSEGIARVVDRDGRAVDHNGICIDPPKDDPPDDPGDDDPPDDDPPDDEPDPPALEEYDPPRWLLWELL